MENNRPTYIASCSFGKDSIATILLAMLHHEPLDRIVTAEVMFDNARGISGEDPDHIQWVKEVAIPRLKELTGIDTEIVRNEKVDYIGEFYHIRQGTKDHPEREGMYQGFPLAGMCRINRDLKSGPLHKYFRKFTDCVQYVGIAIDEPNRLARIDGVKKVSLLAKYGYTEQMAYDLCEKYNLLSPSYKEVTRGGCWFCPNRSIRGFCKFRKKYPNLWNELKEMSKAENVISSGFKYGEPLSKIEARMDSYDRQLTLF